MSVEEHHHLFASVYPELRRMAAARMNYQSRGQTIQPTALVHEAWIRLSAHQTRHWWDDRKKLCAAAAVTMRRILIDRARRRSHVKYTDPSGERLPMDVANEVHVDPDERVLFIHDVLDRLELDNPLYARVVALKVFCGLSFSEIADEMQSSVRTVYRLWKRAKARIYEELIHQR